MFKRKLSALNYHKVGNFNHIDQKEVCDLVIWLEDQKIRFYKVEERKALRNNQNWSQSFKQYLVDLGCPYEFSDISSVLDWLLAHAISLEYADNADKYQNAVENCQKPESSAPQLVQANPLDNLDFESTEFKQGVGSLAQLLNIAHHPDHLVTLKAICHLVTEKFSAEALSENTKIKNSKGKPISLKEMELGFEMGDPVLNQAAKIMRLLYVKDMRELQTSINEAIVAVQTVTANPKTDTRLGKVGR